MKILVAEDDRVNRMLIERWLVKWGYEVCLVEDGQAAWEILDQPTGPSLAILDWMMPKLEGLEVLRRLRLCKTNRFIYSILLTSKSRKEDVVAGLDAGADDFLSKPFNPPELRSRLAAGVRALAYEQELKAKNELLAKYGSEMQALAEARAKQLVHADRMATLGVMAAGIAHEINNPTAFISGNVQTFERVWDNVQKFIGTNLAEEAQADDAMTFALEETPQIISGMKVGVQRISEIVKGLSAYSRQDKPTRQATDLHQRIDQALVICQGKLKKAVTVEKCFDANNAMVEASPGQIEQVLVNLFVNAADAMADKGEGLLRIVTAQSDESSVELRVEDSGPGISPEVLENIFDPFFTTKAVGKGTGLGLAISMGIIEDHHGTLQVENGSCGGACFRIQLPVIETESAA